MTRKAARTALAALFSSPTFTAIYSYAPLDLRGATKVLIIYTDSSRFDRMTRDHKNNFHTFVIETYVKRESGVNTEDVLDDLHEAVVTAAEANPTSATWSHLELSAESEPQFAEVAGVAYRLERHRVTVKLTN